MTRIVRATGTVWIAIVVLSASGCGIGGSPQAADSAQARTALRTALDAWKAGEKPEELAKRTPPLHIKDGDWKDGFQLIGYEANTDGKLVGYDMNYPVNLELKSPKGATVKKKAVYTVTTKPELIVSRQEG
jgi:hypothetical protein